MTIGPMTAVLIGSVAMVVAALSFMKRWRSKRTSAQKSGKLF